MIRYPAVYRDKHGEELTVIENNGRTLSLSVRGVTFVGNGFDTLEPTIPMDSPQLVTFTLAGSDLCDCEIECDMPLKVMVNGRQITSLLHVHLILGAVLANGGVENETLRLRLDLPGKSYRSCGQHGWFEDELLEIQHALPDDAYIVTCFNCAFSDYFPGGSGLFGGLACFRDNKEAYLQVESKSDIFQIWDTMTEWVQETYLCDEFKRRVPGTGYRG